MKYFKPFFFLNDYGLQLIKTFSISENLNITQVRKVPGTLIQNCWLSETYVIVYALSTCSTWVGLLFHELLHQFGVAWSSACCTAGGVMEAQVASIAALGSSALLGLGSLIFLFTITHMVMQAGALSCCKV